MSKQKQSKLDPYAERLDEMFLPAEKGGKGYTLDQAREELRLDGCSVSCSRLSDWWSHRQSARMEEQLLAQITNGARQCQDVEKALGKGVPELETLIKLHRVLILKLSTEGVADPDKLELVNRMMREVQKFARLQQLGEQNRIEERKLALLEERAALASKAEEIAGSNITAEEKAQRMRQIFGLS